MPSNGFPNWANQLPPPDFIDQLPECLKEFPNPCSTHNSPTATVAMSHSYSGHMCLDDRNRICISPTLLNRKMNNSSLLYQPDHIKSSPILSCYRKGQSLPCP